MLEMKLHRGIYFTVFRYDTWTIFAMEMLITFQNLLYAQELPRTLTHTLLLYGNEFKQSRTLTG